MQLLHMWLQLLKCKPAELTSSELIFCSKTQTNNYHRDWFWFGFSSHDISDFNALSTTTSVIPNYCLAHVLALFWNLRDAALYF